MLKIKRLIISNKIIAVCLSILMIGSFAFASASTLFPKPENSKTNCGWYQRRTYYSDATHTTQVGLKIWFCEGLIGRSGTATIYYVEDYCECFEENPE